MQIEIYINNLGMNTNWIKYRRKVFTNTLYIKVSFGSAKIGWFR